MCIYIYIYMYFGCPTSRTHSVHQSCGRAEQCVAAGTHLWPGQLRGGVRTAGRHPRIVPRAASKPDSPASHWAGSRSRPPAPGLLPAPGSHRGGTGSRTQVTFGAVASGRDTGDVRDPRARNAGRRGRVRACEARHATWGTQATFGAAARGRVHRRRSGPVGQGCGTERIGRVRACEARLFASEAPPPLLRRRGQELYRHARRQCAPLRWC